MGVVDPRTYLVEPSFSAPMTHLWVDYDPAFRARHGVFAAGRLVEAAIAKRLGNPVTSTVRLHARDEIADGTLAHGDDVIGQVARVPFVFLAILASGFVAMLGAEADAGTARGAAGAFRREDGRLRRRGGASGRRARRLALHVQDRRDLAGAAALFRPSRTARGRRGRWRARLRARLRAADGARACLARDAARGREGQIEQTVGMRTADNGRIG